MGKIVQNVKFSSVGQKSDLSSWLNPIYQHESKGMLDFRNRATDIKLLKIHANRDSKTYFEIYDF